jgi:hypothetical protein
VIGIPLGIGLYAATSSNRTIPLPPSWTLAAAIGGVVLAAAGLATIPARYDVARPTGRLLNRDL